jgi:hypothetical protein
VTITAADAGVHFSVINDSALTDITVAEAVTTTGSVEDLTAILNAGHTGDWYAVACANASESAGVQVADTLALAPFVEALLPKHVFFNQTSDTDAKTNGGAIAPNFLFAKAFLRSPWFYTEDPGHYPAVSLAGLFSASQPGAIDANGKPLPGVSPTNLTQTQIANIQAKNGNYYTQIVSGASSLNGVIDGRCPNAQWIDDLVGTDFIANQMTVETLNYLFSQPKVPYTDAGISSIANILKKWLTFGVNINLFTNDPKPSITQTPASQVSSTLKAARKVDSTVLTFQAFLASAINKVQITGTVSF